ncbi:MAG: hypothetical protein NC393_08185 [Clostridium sp.]|nr:hypothetical protein [Clostridium sp.]MCM1209099.1 hypothetical protein [Ruminococcus sp.]
MKRISFGTIFLTAAIIIFLARSRDIASSIILMLASLYQIIDIIKEWKVVQGGGKEN